MKESEEIDLNEQQKEFCRLYVSKDFFGNGVQSYIEAYTIDETKPNWYATACVCASKLLSIAKVGEHINSLLVSQGLSDEFVDKQILFLITQHAELGTKLGAIREYNKLKGRIVEKIDLNAKVIKVKVPGEINDND